MRAATALPSVRTMMAVSPARLAETSPFGLTSKTDSSLAVYCTLRVRSSVEPSE